MRTLRVLPFLGLLLLAGAGAPALSGCDSGGGECTTTDTYSTEDITPEGTELGATVGRGQCVRVDYVGRFFDGSGEFDSGTLTFIYSEQASLIPGFILGMTGQQVGETRRVVIPPSLGYGSDDFDPDRDGEVDIPACSTLEFDITVTAVFQDTRQCR